MAPETPIRDIVDRCRVWESHAEFMDHRGDSLTGVTADITPEDQELLGSSLMRHLLPTPVGNYNPVKPLPQERSSFTDTPTEFA